FQIFERTGVQSRWDDAREERAMKLLLEDLFYGKLEKTRDSESERKARVVLFRLDRVDRLARDAEARAEIALRPAACEPELLQPRLQRYFRCATRLPTKRVRRRTRREHSMGRRGGSGAPTSSGAERDLRAQINALTALGRVEAVDDVVVERSLVEVRDL